MISSRPATSRNTSRGRSHPSNTASESAIGSVAATSVPTYGTIRRMPATTPHSAGLGTPITVKTETKQSSKARIDQELHQQVLG